MLITTKVDSSLSVPYGPKTVNSHRSVDAAGHLFPNLVTLQRLFPWRAASNGGRLRLSFPASILHAAICRY